MANWTKATLLQRLCEEVKETLDIDMMDDDADLELSEISLLTLKQTISHSIVMESMRRRIR